MKVANVRPLSVSRGLFFLLLIIGLPVQLTEVQLAPPRRVGKGVLTSVENRRLRWLLLNLSHLAGIRVSFEVV